ncbi:MAG: YidC/Oxa1 family insertase periplasmic-domain containing protein [Puniceicoccales bacterium]|nr:YidC/Oxa1 family insertase periplasmic-domain containing protein [Puniceicoccales bacterium]
MDKKHIFFGVGSLLLAMVLMVTEMPKMQESPRAAPPAAVATPLPDTQIQNFSSAPAASRGNSSTARLQNDFVRAEIALVGGGVRSIALFNHAASRDSDDPWIFDDYDPLRDALTLTLRRGSHECCLSAVTFEIVESDSEHLLLRGKLDDGTSVERLYVLGKEEDGNDPYCFRQEVSLSESAVHWQNVDISLGTLPPTAGDIGGTHLNFVTYSAGKTHFTPIGTFDGSKGFLGIGSRASCDVIRSDAKMDWVAIKNQFFAAILTPRSPADSAHCVPVTLTDSQRGMGGAITLPFSACENGYSVSFSYYVGPKEFLRLERLGLDQERIMQFGWFGFMSKLLLFLMMGIHSLIPNWGLTIILLTTIVKLMLWPLTTAQVRSMRAMAKLKDPLKRIQEKYKKNPQKSRLETMKLLKEHNVNPAAGCLPILIQIPIFLGLYYMLRSAAELRFASFLWMRDLSSCDTVGHLFGVAVNPLPILMAATTFIQMRMGGANSMEGSQKWVSNAMPFVFLFICYNFPSGLVLYWTAQNVFTILQQLVIQRRLNLAETQGGSNSKSAAKKRKHSRPD